MLSISSYSNFTQKFISCLYSGYREHLDLCISKIYLDLKLRYHELYYIHVNTVSKIARGITCCWKSQLHHNLNFLLSYKCLKLYHHFVIIKKLQIIISYDDTCLFVHCNSVSGFWTKVHSLLSLFWQHSWYYLYLNFDVSVKDTQRETTPWKKV